MKSLDDSRVAGSAKGQTRHSRGLGGLAATGLIATLTAPLISRATAATTTALVGLHLVAATVMIPTLTTSLRARTG
jgi:hypothetical protein